VSAPRVSVVIAVKDDAVRLRLCLEALARQTVPRESFEVVVVDNGSADDPAPVAAAFPFVRFLREPRPGVSPARNCGLAQSRGSVLAFTDADCLPHADWLEAGLRRLEEFPRGALVAGRVEVVPFKPGRPEALELFDMAHAFDQRTFVERWHFGATANVFVSRAAVEAVGGFDERIPNYGEDVDFGQRVWKAGWPVAYAPGAVVNHPARRDWASFRGRLARTVRAVYGGHEPTLRRLALDLWHDWPPVSTVVASLVNPPAGGLISGLRLAGVTAGVRLIRARLRLKLFREQRRTAGNPA
jgi:GT2 family glycosyltransferase